MIAWMKKIRHVAVAAAAAAGLAAAPSANAVLVDSVGDSFNVDFYGNGGALDATINFTVTDWSLNGLLGMDYVGLQVNVTNNSTLASSRLTSFSIVDFDPELLYADATGGWDTSRNVNAGGGYNTVDLCVWDGQNCNGGGNQGVAGAGGSETFSLALWFSSLTSAGLDLDPFVAKFQTAAGSYHVDGKPESPTPPTSVPEPGTLALLGLGLIGIAVARRPAARVKS
ncbi:MAG: cistern family PEP-CTERM protein [Steroidobacteraceae bacterium]